MKFRLAAILLILGLSALACEAVTSLNQTEQPSNILFQDDFSDPSSGWDRVNSSDGITDYADGFYRMYVNVVDSDIWANPGLSFTDVRLEVNASKVGGDDNNDFGMICRYQDSSNFYFFVISSDGYYGIGKVKGGQQVLIGMESMPPSEIINQGNASNHLQADCVGSTLALYVNGEKLTEQTDTDFSSGDVGLIAGAFDNPGTDIHFDNFVVMRP
jgi:hypothetical protein